MKKLVSIFLFIVPALVFGQLESEKNDFYLLSTSGKNYPNDSSRNLINFSMAYGINSNAVTNDFLKSLLFRGFIGEPEKDQVTPRLKSVNRGGYEFNTGITYKHYINSKWSFIGGVYDRQQFSAKFSKDVFELTFRGNKNFAGKNADISPLKQSYFNYQSVMFGLSRNVSSKLKIAGGVSLIRGGKFNFVNIKSGNLYTDRDGAFIDLTGNFDFGFTQKTNSSFFKGIGAALNFFVTLNQGKGQWNLEVRDLGVIHYKDVRTYSGNSTYRYDGINVNDILMFNDSIFHQMKADSIANTLRLKKENKSKSFFIPATIHLSYYYDLSDKLDIVAGVKGMLNAGYLPRAYVKGIYYLKPNLILVPMFAYGGFGKEDFELGLAKSFKNDLVISANAFYLEYLILPKKSSGNGFNFSVTKLF